MRKKEEEDLERKIQIRSKERNKQRRWESSWTNLPAEKKENKMIEEHELMWKKRKDERVEDQKKEKDLN